MISFDSLKNRIHLAEAGRGSISLIPNLKGTLLEAFTKAGYEYFERMDGNTYYINYSDGDDYTLSRNLTKLGWTHNRVGVWTDRGSDVSKIVFTKQFIEVHSS